MLTSRQLIELRRSKPTGRNRLALAMELAGCTQVQLAAAIGVGQPRISAIRSGKYGGDGLKVETARALARYFGCAIEDLFPAQQEVA